jgi:hypothetical protein
MGPPPPAYAGPSMLLPDDQIPEIAPPSLLKKAAPQAAPQPRSQIAQHTIMRPSPTRVVQSPTRTQVIQSPVVQRQIFQQPQTIPSPQHARQIIVQPPVRHSPIRVGHPHMMAPMPTQEPYFQDFEGVYPMEQAPGEHLTETDFDGPG